MSKVTSPRNVMRERGNKQISLEKREDGETSDNIRKTKTERKKYNMGKTTELQERQHPQSDGGRGVESDTGGHGTSGLQLEEKVDRMIKEDIRQFAGDKKVGNIYDLEGNENILGESPKGVSVRLLGLHSRIRRLAKGYCFQCIGSLVRKNNDMKAGKK